MAEPLQKEIPVLETPEAGADEARLARMREGDRSAFEEFYRRHTGRVYALAIRLTRNRSEAEEITQEVFVRAWQHRAKLSSPSHARNWLHRVALNLWRNQLRRLAQRGEPLVLEPERTVHPHPGNATRGLRVDLERAVGLLPDRAREVLVLHDILGYRHAEIGGLLGIATNTSKVQLHRARKRLRKVLET